MNLLTSFYELFKLRFSVLNCRTLTKHLSPPDVLPNKNAIVDTAKDLCETNNFENLEELISYEEKNVLDLLDVVLKVAPAMLGHDSIKKSKQSGESIVLSYLVIVLK